MQSKEDKYLIDIVNNECDRIKNSLIDTSENHSKIFELDKNSYEFQTFINGSYNRELTIKDELLNIINLVDTYSLVNLLNRYELKYKYNVVKYSLYALEELDTLNEQTRYKTLKSVKKSLSTDVNNMRDNGYIFTIKKPKGRDEIERILTKNIKDEFCNQGHLKDFIVCLLDKKRFNAKNELIAKPLNPTSKMSIEELENLKAQLQETPTINLRNLLK